MFYHYNCYFCCTSTSLHFFDHSFFYSFLTDLKPDNIGFTLDGDLKVFDFGLCTCVRQRGKCVLSYEMTGNTGSLRYMAPEVALRQSYSEKVDVYSYGVILWQMASDTTPFKGLTKTEFMRRIIRGGERPKIPVLWPSQFGSLLRACWDHDPRIRPSFEKVVLLLDIMMKSRILQ